jgi:hypothetical protein
MRFWENEIRFGNRSEETTGREAKIDIARIVVGIKLGLFLASRHDLLLIVNLKKENTD